MNKTIFAFALVAFFCAVINAADHYHYDDITDTHVETTPAEDTMDFRNDDAKKTPAEVEDTTDFLANAQAPGAPGTPLPKTPVVAVATSTTTIAPPTTIAATIAATKKNTPVAPEDISGWVKALDAGQKNFMKVSASYMRRVEKADMAFSNTQETATQAKLSALQAAKMAANKNRTAIELEFQTRLDAISTRVKSMQTNAARASIVVKKALTDIEEKLGESLLEEKATQAESISQDQSISGALRMLRMRQESMSATMQRYTKSVDDATTVFDTTMADATKAHTKAVRQATANQEKVMRKIDRKEDSYLDSIKDTISDVKKTTDTAREQINTALTNIRESAGVDKPKAEAPIPSTELESPTEPSTELKSPTEPAAIVPEATQEVESLEVDEWAHDS